MSQAKIMSAKGGVQVLIADAEKRREIKGVSLGRNCDDICEHSFNEWFTQQNWPGCLLNAFFLH